MNAKHIIAGVAIVAVGLIGSFIYSSSNAPVAEAQVHAQTEQFLYEDFSEESFEMLKGQESFAVFVHSRTCGTCAKKHRDIINKAGDFSAGTILKLEYSNASQEFIEMYEVTSHDTFILFDAEGNHETTLGQSVMDVKMGLAGEMMDKNEMEEKDMDKEAMMDEPSEKPVVEAAAQEAKAAFVYADYTEAQYAGLKGEEPFALFFHSRTCGTCAKKDAQIMNEKDLFDGGTILKVEYEEAPTELLARYGVTKYDTFVVFDTSGEATTMLGGSVEAVRTALNA